MPKAHMKDKQDLPLGMRYNESTKKYQGWIRFCGSDESLKLSEWDTPEEAFEEYRDYKLDDIRRWQRSIRKEFCKRFMMRCLR